MTTPPPEAPEGPYIVRLVMRVQAPVGEPGTAAANFVDLLTSNGMRDWVYRVEDVNSGEVLGYYDGYGDAVDIEAMTEPPAAQSMPGPAPDPDTIKEPLGTPITMHTPDVEDVQLPHDDPDTPYYDARDAEGRFAKEPESDADLEALAESLNEGDADKQE